MEEKLLFDGLGEDEGLLSDDIEFDDFDDEEEDEDEFEEDFDVEEEDEDAF